MKLLSPSIRWTLLGLGLLLAIPSLRAEVKLHPLFSNGAVLQRGKPVPVWGTADDGERVTVTLHGKTVTAIGKGGRWQAVLPALEAGGPFEMTVKGMSNTRVVQDILVGEVWVCSGQSNMDMVVSSCDRAEEELAHSSHPTLRFCKVPRQAADVPQSTAALAWQACGPQTVGNLSAVGYFFARDLQAVLKVPVGLIDAAYGGTPAEAWMSPEALQSRPEFQPILDEFAAQVKDSPRAMAQYETELAEWKVLAASAKQAGQERPGKPHPQIPMGPHNFRRPSGLYKGMVQPLVPYAIQGIIWYQGERNSPRALQYRTLFPALIADWRKVWQQGDIPFLFAQLAPFGAAPRTPQRVSLWAELREAQLMTSQAVPRTAMAVITDVGDPTDIHPKRKQPVGARLALAARAVAYGEKIVFRGPTFKTEQVQGSKIILTFSDVGEGLVCQGEPLQGFAVCGPDRKFVNADAKIVGDTIEVSAAEVPVPVAARFGWADFPVVNLWNKDGFPASPFRTDETY